MASIEFYAYRSDKDFQDYGWQRATQGSTVNVGDMDSTMLTIMARLVGASSYAGGRMYVDFSSTNSDGNYSTAMTIPSGQSNYEIQRAVYDSTVLGLSVGQSGSTGVTATCRVYDASDSLVMNQTISFTVTFTRVSSSSGGSSGSDKIIELGNLKLDGVLKKHTESRSAPVYNNEYSIPTFTFDDSSTNWKWKWLKFTDSSGVEKLISTVAIFKGCTYEELTKSFGTITLGGKQYVLSIPSREDFERLNELNLLSYIDNYPTSTTTSTCHVITSSEGTVNFNNGELTFSKWAPHNFAGDFVMPILTPVDSSDDGDYISFGIFAATVPSEGGTQDIDVYMGNSKPLDQYGNHTYYINTAECACYDFILIPEIDSSLYDRIKWVTATYNNKQYYISTTYVFANLEYFEATAEQKVCVVDGNMYRITLMPIEFWQSLPSNTVKKLGTYTAWTNTQYGAYEDYQSVIFTHTEDLASISISYKSKVAGLGETAVFVPVLEPVDNLYLSDKIQIGYWLVYLNTGVRDRYGYGHDRDVMFSYDYIAKVSEEFSIADDEYMGNSCGPLKWLAWTEPDYNDLQNKGVHDYLICQNFGIRSISYNQVAELFLNRTVKIFDNFYRFTLLSASTLFDLTNDFNIFYDWNVEGCNYQFNRNNNDWYALTSDINTDKTTVTCGKIKTYGPYNNGAWDTTVGSRNDLKSYSTTYYSSDLFYIPILQRIKPPTINIGNTDLGSITSWTNIIYSVNSGGDLTTVKEYLNGSLVNPVINNHDSTVTPSLTFKLNNSTFGNLAVNTKHTITIEATNSAGTATATITFTKTDGKIKLGYWDAISETGKTTNFYPTGSIQSIVGAAYSEIILNTSNTGENLYTWIPFTVNNKKFYICDQFGINYISYYEVFNKIINRNIDVVINGYNYRLTLLKREDLAKVRDIGYNFYSAIDVINNDLSADGRQIARVMTSSAGSNGISINTFDTATYQYDVDTSHQSLYYLPILVQTEETSVKIVYSGNKNLGVISQPPTITYSTKGATGNVQIQELIDGKSIGSKVATVGATNTLTVSESVWKTIDPDVQKYIEIRVTDGNNNSDILVIPFTKLQICNQINAYIGTLETPKRCVQLSLSANAVGLNENIVSVQWYACNNAFDENPTWIGGTHDSSENVCSFDLSSSTTKTASNWGVAAKIVIKSQENIDNYIVWGINGTAIILEGGTLY